MKRRILWTALFFVLVQLANAQTPTGTIAGVVRDPSGAVVAGASVRVVNQSTGLGRSITSAEEGDYAFPVLPVGLHEVTAQAGGFERIVRIVSVEAGTTTTTDFVLSVGVVTDSVRVDGVSPQLRYDSHYVGGSIGRSQIENLPLNGRNFLELAKLEPGVQPPTRSSSNRMFVPILGAPGGNNNGRGTRVTIDGGSIMAVGNGGSAMAFSQEGTAEFQISSVNFDLSTGLTFAGAVNAVTRSGGNNLHGIGFYFYRDHNLAAYPALKRDLDVPEPFFRRQQFGFAIGGPIHRDRLFFFMNWERNEQRGLVTSTLSEDDFAHLSRITPSPLFGNQISLRLDGRLSNAHTAFLRYSHDGSRGFGPPVNQPTAYPSYWTRQLAWADQSLLGLTSVVRPTLVNDLRFSYFFVSSSQVPPTQRDCNGCLGIGAPTITIAQTDLSIGGSDIQRTLGRRFHLSDNVTWQRGTHRARFGVDWEYNRGGVLNWSNEPVSMTLFSPIQVRDYNARAQTPAELRIPLPARFDTLNAILQLPLQSIVVGIGDPRVPQENGGRTRIWNTVRLFFNDTWRLQDRLTMNYGLGWSVDRNLNHDLTKPALLAPILGTDGLGPTRKQWANFSPVLGMAWSPSRDGKTVIRAGAGIFYDFLFPPYLETERALLGPPSLFRQNISGGVITNTLPGIADVPVGRPLSFSTPTLFTGAQLVTILPGLRAALSGNLTNADPSVRAIQISKEGTLNPTNVPSPTAQHINIGFQRQVAPDVVLSADFAYRHFVHLGSTSDLNHFDSIRGPIVPKCVGETQMKDPQALCSNGRIFVQESSGRATYKGLLLRADKRFSHAFQILGSYAYSSNVGTNPGNGFDLDNRLANVGPLNIDYTHIANFAGVVHLPWLLRLGLNFSYSSAAPFSAFVGGIDFNGDGTMNDLLPGTRVNGLNRGVGRTELESFVDQFNLSYAGQSDPHNQTIPRLILPANYALGDDFQTLDIRLSRLFLIRERWRLALIGETFNLYNAANLSGHLGNLTRPSFGQPAARSTQVFGSGGPRSFQLALKATF